MRRIAVTRTIHALPGKRQQYLEFLEQANDVRRKWGMLESYVMEKAIDPQVVFMLQVWRSEEDYLAWQQSAERAKIMSDGRHWRVREPSLLYRMVEDEQ